MDVVGWFDPTGLRYVPLLPIRAFDSRTGRGGASTLVGGRTETISLQAAGLPRAARAVVMTTTATNSTTATHVTVWDSGAAAPGTSDLNVYPGENTANLVVAGISGASVDTLLGGGRSDLLGDVLGYCR